MKKRLENIIDFTGDENDYVVFSDLYEHFNGSVTPKKVGDALVKMGIVGKIKRVDGKAKSVRLGIKLKDFENITEEYGDDTSAELSFASTDAEMVSPMRNKSDVAEIEKLRAKNKQLEQELAYIQEEFQNEIKNRPDSNDKPGPFTPNKMKLALDASMAEAEIGKLKAEITALKHALENAEKNSIIPQVNNKKIEQLLTTSSETMRTATVQNVLKGLWAKNQQMETEQLDQLQRETELTEELNDLLVKEEEKNKNYLTIIKQVEKQTKTIILDDDREVLPDVLKRAKDVALVDTFDTE